MTSTATSTRHLRRDQDVTNATCKSQHPPIFHQHPTLPATLTADRWGSLGGAQVALTFGAQRQRCQQPQCTCQPIGGRIVNKGRRAATSVDNQTASRLYAQSARFTLIETMVVTAIVAVWRHCHTSFGNDRSLAGT